LLVKLFGEVATRKQIVAEQREEIASGMDKATEPAKLVRIRTVHDAAKFAPASASRTAC
jgi:hypothetical protein